MNTIYTFTILDEVKDLDSIKILCYFIYDKLNNMEDINGNSILLDKGIITNDLLEEYDGTKYHYNFQYKDYSSGKYEPFMIGSKTFGFTVKSPDITEKEILDIVNEQKARLGYNYEIYLESIMYHDEDPKNRLITIKQYLEDNTTVTKTKTPYLRRLIPMKFTLH